MVQNAWLKHVQDFRRRNPGLQFKELLKQARQSYGGNKRGGNPDGPTPFVSNNLASRSAKFGGGPVPFEKASLATRSATVGGRKRRTRKRKSKRK
jgi:hypothetical protein